MKFNKNILCIGAGYVGGPTMAVIAAKCPDYKVTVVDINEERIARLAVRRAADLRAGPAGGGQARRAAATSSSPPTSPPASREADIIFVCVNTPDQDLRRRARAWPPTCSTGRRPPARSCEHSDRAKIVVEKSTLPVRTAEAMERILNANGSASRTSRSSPTPSSWPKAPRSRDLEHPDRVLIGCAARPRTGQAAAQAIVDIYAHWVPRERILTTNLWTTELSKLVANAFLAQRISSINAISALCEKTEADVGEVARAVGMDSPHRPALPQGQRRLRRLLLQEGHPEPGLHLRALRPATRWRATGSRWCG